MSKYLSTTHVTYNLGYHVVFCPKYRYNLLRYRAADKLKELLSEKARQLHISIPTMEVMPDHVHLFICAPRGASLKHQHYALQHHPTRHRTRSR